MFEIIEKENIKDLDNVVADKIKESIDRVLEGKDYVVLGIVGGRSVRGVFDQLKNVDVAWDKVHIFMVDERLVSIDSKESNFRQANELFISDLMDNDKTGKGNVHPFILEKDLDDYGVRKYEEELKKYGGKFDVVLLSSGGDGHVGALYPNHSSIESDEEFFITMEDSPKPPKKRMSASRKLLERSKFAFVLFYSDEKKKALKNFKNPELSVLDCPVKLVNEISETYVFTDIGSD